MLFLIIISKKIIVNIINQLASYLNQKKEQIISFLEPLPYLNTALPPNQQSYDKWIKDKKCQIYIDDEKVDNSALNSYKTNDFVMYFTSSLRRNGGKPDEYRVDLWTETGFKKFNEQFFEKPVSIDKLLEIEPEISFLLEKVDNKPITLLLHAEYGWIMFKTTSSGITPSFSAPTPSTYFPKQ